MYFCIMKKEIRRVVKEYYTVFTAVIIPIIEEEEGSSRLEGDSPTVLPQKYSIFAKIFSPKGIRILAPFNEYTYTIELESDIVPLYSPIYSLIKPEFEVLQEYLNNTIKKDWIYPSYSLVGTLILFILKKGG